MQEIWKDVLDYEGLYQVSDLGNVKSLSKSWYAGKNGNRLCSKPETIMKPDIDGSGYRQVKLYKLGQKPKVFKVHRLVYEAFNGKTSLFIDHIIEGNPSDNRLCNLQAVSHRQNTSKYHLSTNKSSRFTGVTWHKQRNKWKAEIYNNGKKRHLGSFTNEIDASNAYQNALKSLT